MKPSRSSQPLANMEEQRKVERLAWECVKARQPGGSLPGWIFHGHQSDEIPKGDGTWRVETWIYRTWTLRPGEFWLQENGRKRLAHRDPDTGEVRVYISYDEQPDAGKVTLFVAIVDPFLGRCELESLVDVAALNSSDFELWY